MAIRIGYMVLADAAASAEGKLYIHGAGWNRINVASFPVTYAFAVAVQLCIPWTDTNQPCRIEFDIVDDDERSIFPDEAQKINGEIVAGRPPALEVGDEQVVSIALRVNPEFQRPGHYTAVIRLDGVIANRARFRVVAAQKIQVAQQ